MSRQLKMCLAVLPAFGVLAAGNLVQAQYGAAVISYSAGSTAQPGYTDPSVAIGSPERVTGESMMFSSVVTPFNSPFGTDEIVSVGEGGQLTLRLSHYVVPQPGAPEIGVFENVFLNDPNYPQGHTGPSASSFGGDSALVEVSQNGAAWVSLGNILFDLPANGYADLTDPYALVPGSVQSDFRQPFTGTVSSFDDKSFPEILGVLAGSGGGKWLDISGTGLAAVGYIRFSVAPDLTPGVNLNFELDAVSISHAALGAPVVPEPATIASTILGLWLLVPLHRCRRKRGE